VQEKQMGSRAIVIACRDADAARRHFGVLGDGVGACYTRTGRRFIDDEVLERGFREHVRNRVDGIGLFDRLESDWVLLDCELMPWSAKAQELLRDQYAAVGVAATIGSGNTLATLKASERIEGVGALVERFSSRAEDAGLFVDAYRRNCWPVRSLNDFKLAPFHVLASNGNVHLDKPHTWHMEVAGELANDDPLFKATAWHVVDTTDPDSQQAGTAWWQSMTDAGGEGMVVKPMDFVATGRRGLIQPALKTRGREYLRIIHGPEYTEPQNLERLRQRGLGRKRSLAGREFALGIEALERFARGEPLRGVHECVFGVLALESEPVDPRL
jgi:protein phosphatase